mmetsp:Transcript_14205/g.42673  ORF Transcript_14205/g.42673 Transcript_14205/m.42673 type:complete len:243 (-) Transcript_14205:71-799(-)
MDRLHVVAAAGVELAQLAGWDLPLAAAIAVKLAWLWEFHLRAEDATKHAHSVFGFLVRVGWGLALLPVTGVMLRDHAPPPPLAPVAEALSAALAAVAATAQYLVVAARTRRLDWKAPAAAAACAVIPLRRGPFRWARRLARRVKKRPLAPPESCDASDWAASLAPVLPAIAGWIDADVTRFFAVVRVVVGFAPVWRPLLRRRPEQRENAPENVPEVPGTPRRRSSRAGPSRTSSGPRVRAKK